MGESAKWDVGKWDVSFWDVLLATFVKGPEFPLSVLRKFRDYLETKLRA